MCSGLFKRVDSLPNSVNVTVYALSAFLSFFAIERLGRRKLFIIGSAGQAVSMFIGKGCSDH